MILLPLVFVPIILSWIVSSSFFNRKSNTKNTNERIGIENDNDSNNSYNRDNKNDIMEMKKRIGLFFHRQRKHKQQQQELVQQQQQQQLLPVSLLSTSTTSAPASITTPIIPTSATMTATTATTKLHWYDTNTNNGKCSILSLLLLTMILLYMIYVMVSKFLTFYRLVYSCYVLRRRRHRRRQQQQQQQQHGPQQQQQQWRYLITRSSLPSLNRARTRPTYEERFHISVVSSSTDTTSSNVDRIRDDDEGSSLPSSSYLLLSSDEQQQTEQQQLDYVQQQQSSAPDSVSSSLSGSCYDCSTTLNVMKPIDIAGQTCPICLSSFEMNDLVTSCHDGCKNYYHKDCLFEWLQRSTDCPCCRKQLIDDTPASVHPTNTNNDDFLNRNHHVLLDFSCFLGYYTH